MATAKIPVTLDFSSGNLNVIQKQIHDAVQTIEKNGIELGLSPETISRLKTETQKLGDVVAKNINNTTGKVKWDGVLKGLDKAGISAAALGAELKTMGVEGTKAFNSITKSATTFEAKVRNTDSLIYKMGTTLANTLKWNISSSLVNQFSGQVQKAYYFTKDLDRSLNSIRIVSGASKDEMADFAIEANNAAKALRTSTVEYSDAALVYFQQGMSAEDVKKMTDATVMGANIAGESTEEMSNLLTSVMNGYKMTANEVLNVTDKLSAVGAATAADFYELATGMSKVASMANAAGVPIDELNAQLATITSVTKEAPESIGTSLKTIYGRMLAFKNNATDLMKDDDGELYGLPSVESALKKFSLATNKEISLFKTTADGTKVMRELGDVINDIGDAWQTTDNQAVRFGLTTALAGSRQQNRLVALFDSWDEYQNSVETSINSTGTTMKQNEVYMESYEAHVKSLQASAEALYMELFNSDDMIGTVDAMNEIIKGLTAIVDLLGGLPGILGVIGGIVAKTGFSKQFSGLASMISNKKINASYTGSADEGSYATTENDYKQRLSTVSDVYKGEDFERIRKMTEEFLAQKKAIEELSARARILKESYDNAFQIITTDLKTDLFNELAVGEEGVIQNTDTLVTKLQQLRDRFGEGLTAEATAELNSFISEAEQDGYTIQALENNIAELAETMNQGARPYEEMAQTIREQNVALQANEEVLNRSLTPMEETAKKVAFLRDGVSGSIPVLSTFFSVMGDESKSAGDKALSVLTSLGSVILMNSDKIIANTVAKYAEIVATNAETASETANTAARTGGIAAIWESVTAKVASTAASISATIANGGLTASFVAMGSAIWTALAPILPFVAAIGALVAAGYGLVKLFDALVITETELKDSSDKAAESLKEVDDKVKELTSSMESLQEQIQNLDPITDADEIAKLERQLQLTEAQKVAEEELAKIRAKEASEAQTKYLEKTYGTTTRTASGNVESSTKTDDYKKALEDRKKVAKSLSDLGIQDVSEVSQVVETKQAQLATKTGADKQKLEKEIKDIKKLAEEYDSATTTLTEQTNTLLEEVSKVDIDQIADADSRAFVESLQNLAESGLAELNPASFVQRMFEEADLNSIMEKMSANEDYNDVLDKYSEKLNTLGISTDQAKEYLQAYSDTLEKNAVTTASTQDQYDSLVFNMTTIQKSYDDGTIKLDEYTAGMYKNLEALAALKVGNADLATSIDESALAIINDMSPALEEINTQYANGTISIDDYIKSAKAQAESLLELKEAFPELSDAIDDLLNKSFDMDGLQGLLDTDTLIDQWKGTQDVISQVSSEFENLASVQELVADGFRISAEAAAELANMYPQLLENAQTTADGQVLLDEGVYNSFLKSREGMLSTDIDTQIAILEGQKAVLEADKAKAQAELELVNAVASGTIDIENAKDTMLADSAQTLTQYLIDLGMNEVDAQKAAAEAMAGNMEQFNTITAGVADDTAKNLAGAMSAAATSSADNVGKMVNHLDTLGKQAAKVAEQIANTAAGVTTYSGPVVLGAGGGTDGSGFKATLSQNKFTGVEAKQADAFRTEMAKWQDRLQVDISGYTKAIGQIDAQIAVLNSLKTRNMKGKYADPSKAGSKGGGSKKETEEYLVELDQFKKAAEALAQVQKEIAETELAFDNATTSAEKLELLKKKIELYGKERDALHNLNKARRAVIQSNISDLRGKGFDIAYDADKNELAINNMEHINELKGKDAEATNELRKDVEDLIKSTEDLNKANEDGSKSWMENYYKEKELLKEKLDTTLAMYTEQLDQQEYYAESSIESVETTLVAMINAIQTAAKEGAITAAEAFEKVNEVSMDALSRIKDAIDLQIKAGEAQGGLTLENEVDLWQRYINDLQEAFDAGTISYKEYINNVVDAYNKITALKEKIIQEQIDDKDATAKAVASVIDDKIAALEKQKEALEDIANLDNMILDLRSELASADKANAKVIQSKIDYLTEQKAIYNSLTDAEEKRLKMEQIEAVLADYTLQQLQKKIDIAKKNLVQRVWYEDRGWVWEADEQAISEAEQALIDYQNQMNSDAIDKQIEALENYKEQWTSVADVYQTEQDKLIAAQQLGADWESKILAQRIDTLDKFVKDYNSLLTSLNEVKNMSISDVTGSKLSSSKTNDKGSSSESSGIGYNKDTDYSARMNEIVNTSSNYAGGQLSQGAKDELSKLEKQRNAKIDGMGLTQYKKTNQYAEGGINTETAYAALHGTKQKAETIFNANDAKKLYDLIHNADDLTEVLADKIVPYVPDLFGSIAEIGLSPKVMSMGTPKIPTTTKVEDNSTTFENCTFEVTSGADSFDALVKDIEIKTKNR